MGHDDVASGYPISTGFHRLMGYQLNPRDRGVTKILRNQIKTLKENMVGKVSILNMKIESMVMV